MINKMQNIMYEIDTYIALDVLKSNLWYYNNTYILVKGNVTIT